MPRGMIAPMDSARLGRMGLFVQVSIEITPSSLGSRSFSSHVIGYRLQVTNDVGRELLGYHWHPSGVSAVREPHLHVFRPLSSRTDSEKQDGRLDGVHLPTGVIDARDFIRFLILELAVEPVREDWRRLLNST